MTITPLVESLTAALKYCEDNGVPVPLELRLRTYVFTRFPVKGGAGSGNFGHAGRPGEVGGSAPLGVGGKLQSIKEKEDAIRYITSHEESLIVDGDGKIIIEKRGETERVKYSDKELDTIQGTKNLILTHNHPIVASISNGDLEFAAYYDLAEMRVVDSKYTYIIMRPPGGWDKSEIGKMKSTWTRVANSTAKDYISKIRFDNAPADLLNEITTHAATLAVSEKYGVPYVRIPNK